MNSIEETFFLQNFSLDTIFDLLSRSDYFLIQQIRAACETSERPDGVYLSELAQYWNADIPDVSKIIKRLEEKGYVYWNLDENKKRTWVKITEYAKKQLSAQQAKMKNVYEKILISIPQEDLRKTFETMKQIRTFINTNERFL